MYNQMTTNEKLIVVTSISILLPFYFAAFILVFDFYYILINSDYFKSVKSFKYYKNIRLFVIYSLVMSLIFTNILGILASISFYIVLVDFIFIYNNINTRTFKTSLRAMFCVSIFWFSRSFLILINNYLNLESKVSLIKFITESRTASIFLNANYYGMIAGFMLIYGLSHIVYKKGYKNLIYLTYVIFAFFALIHSGSRGALFGSFVGSIYILLKSKDKKVLSLLIVVFFVSIFYLQVTGKFAYTRLDSFEEDLMVRKKIWARAENFLKTHFLVGAGPFSMFVISPSVGKFTIIHAHNLFLDMLINFGVLGLYILYPLVKDIFLKLIIRDSNKYYNMSIGLIIMTLSHGLLDVTILNHQCFYLLFFPICYLCSLSKKDAAFDGLNPLFPLS